MGEGRPRGRPQGRLNNVPAAWLALPGELPPVEGHAEVMGAVVRGSACRESLPATDRRVRYARAGRARPAF